MSRHLTLLAAIALLGVAGTGPRAAAQTSPTGPHLVVIRLVEDVSSPTPYAFVPSTLKVERGDTVRFLQVADTPHDVRFTKTPAGAKIARFTSPMLVSRGDKFDLVIDARFPDGTYSFVCDPHEALGMKATFTVTPH